MKFEIDTDALKWIEVPGSPTLGSFANRMRQEQFRRREKDADPKWFMPEDLYAACPYGIPGNALIKYTTPFYDQWSTGNTGAVPIGQQTLVDFFVSIELAARNSGLGSCLRDDGPERVVAVCVDLVKPMNQLVRALVTT